MVPVISSTSGLLRKGEALRAAPVEFQHRAAQASRDQAHLSDWADAVADASALTSFLVARPSNAGSGAVGYPSAVRAYRELTELVTAL